MEETAEFIHLRFNFYQRSRVFLNEIDVRDNFVLEVFILHIELIDHMLLLEDLQKLFAIIQGIEVLYPVVNVTLKALELIQCLICKVLWWGPIVLHRLQVAYYFLGVRLLFVNDALEHVELLVYLFCDLLFKGFLVQDAVLHFGALAQVHGASFVDLLELLDMLIRCLFQSEGFAPLIRVLEVAIIAQGGILDRTEDSKLVLMVAKFDLLVLY